MKSILLSGIALWCLLSTTVGATQATNIQLVANYFEGDPYNYPTNVVKLRIVNATLNDIHSETELLLSNTSKTSVDKPIILQNEDRTVTGFMASVARASYKIIIVYISINGEAVIDQNFNLKVAEVLKKNSPDSRFDADGLYLDHIDKKTLRIGFQSDSGKGSFKFQVQLTPDGQIKMVPKSIVFDN
jgi:hypothetical protein